MPWLACKKERHQDTTAGNVDGVGDVTGNRIHGEAAHETVNQDSLCLVSR